MKNDLSKFSTGDIEKELERRRNIPPFPTTQIDPFWTLVVREAEWIRNSINGGIWDDDYLHNMYNVVMTTVFGPTYFEWEKYKDLRH
jgi:hypothetical protein